MSQNGSSSEGAAYGILSLFLFILCYVATPILVTIVYYRWAKYKTFMPFLAAFSLLALGSYLAANSSSSSMASYAGAYIGCIALFWLLLWFLLAIYKMVKYGKWKVLRRLYISGRQGIELQSQVKIFLLGMLVISPCMVISTVSPNNSSDLLSAAWYFSLIIGSIIFGVFTFTKWSAILDWELRVPKPPTVEIISNAEGWEN